MRRGVCESQVAAAYVLLPPRPQRGRAAGAEHQGRATHAPELQELHSLDLLGDQVPQRRLGDLAGQGADAVGRRTIVDELAPDPVENPLWIPELHHRAGRMGAGLAEHLSAVQEAAPEGSEPPSGALLDPAELRVDYRRGERVAKELRVYRSSSSGTKTLSSGRYPERADAHRHRDAHGGVAEVEDHEKG